MTGEVRREYVEARRIVLDALTGIRPYLDAFVLIGAQAVYLRTIDRLPGYQPYTTDADLAFDPARLGEERDQIAASLFISQRTVDAHLSHIRTKFGLADRVKLAITGREYLTA